MKNAQLQYAAEYEQSCSIFLSKIAKIRKVKSKWVVFSEKGKRLGTYDTKAQAVKRLKSIEFWKHKKASLDIDNKSYSSIVRELRKNKDLEILKSFQKEYKNSFDKALLDGEENPEEIALEKSIQVIAMQKEHVAIVKAAAAIELGDPIFAGKYLADIVKFLLRRISIDSREKALKSMQKKIYYLNEYEIAGKKTPPSSSMGQSVTILKTILLDHDPKYIRSVLNQIVRNLL